MPKWYLGDLAVESGCTSFFPEISPYCSFGESSGGKFIVSWYFDDESEFSKGQDALYRYLEEKGNVSQQKLNISTELQEVAQRREAENSSERPSFGPYYFNVIGYESPETSGYFLVYKRPFLKDREDYFIMFYGIKNTANLIEKTPDLKKLVAESYYMANENGKIEGLTSEVKDEK